MRPWARWPQEFPLVLNALSRFNVYQEVVLAYLYRAGLGGDAAPLVGLSLYSSTPPWKIRHMYTVVILQGGVPITHAPFPWKIRHTYTLCISQGGVSIHTRTAPCEIHIHSVSCGEDCTYT
jgi:hypothetical protein